MGTNPTQNTGSCLDREAVLRQVIRIVSEQGGVRADQVHPTSRLVDDLGFDSLTLVETALEIDEEFDISVPDELMGEVRTVEDVVDGILEVLGAAGDSGQGG